MINRPPRFLLAAFLCAFGFSCTVADSQRPGMEQPTGTPSHSKTDPGLVDPAPQAAQTSNVSGEQLTASKSDRGQQGKPSPMPRRRPTGGRIAAAAMNPPATKPDVMTPGPDPVLPRVEEDGNKSSGDASMDSADDEPPSFGSPSPSVADPSKSKDTGGAKCRRRLASHAIEIRSTIRALAPEVLDIAASRFYAFVRLQLNRGIHNSMRITRDCFTDNEIRIISQLLSAYLKSLSGEYRDAAKLYRRAFSAIEIVDKLPSEFLRGHRLISQAVGHCASYTGDIIRILRSEILLVGGLVHASREEINVLHKDHKCPFVETLFEKFYVAKID